MKKKMDTMTKAKLIYSGELFVFAIAFLVVAILEFTQVIKISERHHIIFNWVTLFGGSWLIADFIWALADKKRQKRIAMIDKIIHLPLGIYLIAFDLFCLISKPSDPNIYQYGIPSALTYICLCYIFESLYHFKYPVPGLVDIDKDEKEVVASQDAEFVQEQNEEEQTEEKGDSSKE